jgi:hypothetical protein
VAKETQAEALFVLGVDLRIPWAPPSNSPAKAGSLPSDTQGSIRSKVAPSTPIIRTLPVFAIILDNSFLVKAILAYSDEFERFNHKGLTCRKIRTFLDRLSAFPSPKIGKL